MIGWPRGSPRTLFAPKMNIDSGTRNSGRARHRVRFEKVERKPGPDKRRVQVTLGWHDVAHTGVAAIETGGEVAELRTAANATVQALEDVIGRPLELRLIGSKRFRAFDEEFVVVSLHRQGDSPARLVGIARISSDTLSAGVLAVLNAVNRLLGNYLDVPND